MCVGLTLSEEKGLDVAGAMRSAAASLSSTSTGEAADDDTEEAGNAVDNGLEDTGDAVNYCHDAGSDSLEQRLDLLLTLATDRLAKLR